MITAVTCECLWSCKSRAVHNTLPLQCWEFMTTAQHWNLVAGWGDTQSSLGTSAWLRCLECMSAWKTRYSTQNACDLLLIFMYSWALIHSHLMVSCTRLVKIPSIPEAVQFCFMVPVIWVVYMASSHTSLTCTAVFCLCSMFGCLAQIRGTPSGSLLLTWWVPARTWWKESAVSFNSKHQKRKKQVNLLALIQEDEEE